MQFKNAGLFIVLCEKWNIIKPANKRLESGLFFNIYKCQYRRTYTEISKI